MFSGLTLLLFFLAQRLSLFIPLFARHLTLVDARPHHNIGLRIRVTKIVVQPAALPRRSVHQFLFYVAAHELSTANLVNCGKNGAATNAEVTDGLLMTVITTL